MKHLFVTGTDTDVGKTFVSALLLKGLSKFQRVTYFKPIQSGDPTDTSTIQNWLPDTPLMPPTYQFALAASPDRAAAAVGGTIELQKVLKDWQNKKVGFHLVEGAGGVMVPLNSTELMIDLIDSLKIPCLVVASTRLGTINHTLMTIEVLKKKQIPVAGIVLNGPIDPGLKDLLEAKTNVPVVFQVPAFETWDERAIAAWVEKDEDFKTFLKKLISEMGDSAPAEKDWQKLDEDHIWHPFTQHGIVRHHPLVTSAKGAYLQMGNKKVIDAVSSWWVNLLGHCRDEISEAIAVQTKKLEHVIFAGFTHEPAICLSETLVNEVKSRDVDLSKVFFSDNGSTAVEVALKMAYQYHQQSGHGKRRRFLALQGSYHGDTLGAMSVGERKGFNEVFNPLLFSVDYVDPFSPEQIEQAFLEKGEEYAAVILEPMVQGASGMRMYGAELLNRLQVLCHQHSVFKICDEVFTGFYRTGKMFAFEHSQLKPDFLCLSKGLTGGFLPLAVTLTRSDLFDFFAGDDMRKAFLHGHSYTANPIACAAANATLKLLGESETQLAIQRIGDWTASAVDELMSRGCFFRGRSLGTIGALEVFDEDPHYFKGDFSYRFNQAALRKGVLLRPLGGTVYAVPPYCVEKSEIEKIYETMFQVLKEEF